MAHAYETLAHGGERVSGTMALADEPVGIQEVDAGSHALPAASTRSTRARAASCPRASRRPRPRCSKPWSSTAPGKAAAIGQFAAGKTGTTSNFGDAWFVGWNDNYTVAVWVGYPDRLGPDGTRLRRPAGDGWHLPGADLARLPDRRAADRQDPRRRSRGQAQGQGRRGQETGSSSEEETSSTPGSSRTRRRALRRRHGLALLEARTVDRQGRPARAGGRRRRVGRIFSAGQGAPATPAPTHDAPPPSEPSTPSPSPTGGVSPNG